MGSPNDWKTRKVFEWFDMRARVFVDGACWSTTIEITLDGKVVLGSDGIEYRFVVTSEAWPTEKNRCDDLCWITPPSRSEYLKALQWEYCRRLLAESMKMHGDKPDQGIIAMANAMESLILEAAKEASSDTSS